LGGDEFAVVCPDVERAEDMQALAARLVEAISRPIALGDEELQVGASVGISLAAPGACSIDVLVDAADAALYEVKSGDKGGWHLSEVFHRST
jgi:diguanylate cyclase (GGDEF)-like protein